MGWMTRFEPATSGSTDRRSNQLSYIHHKSSIVIILIFGRFCQKNFPPRFCKPGRTNKQPLIKSAAAEHKNPSRRANFPKRSLKPHRARPKHANPPGARVPQGRAFHANTARGKRSTGGANSSRCANLARHAKPAGSGRSARPCPKPTHSTGRAFRKAAPCKHRRAWPNYLAGAAVCGAGKWRRLWRTWFCASTRSSAGHKHICKNLSILCWLPPKKVSCR